MLKWPLRKGGTVSPTARPGASTRGPRKEKQKTKWTKQLIINITSQHTVQVATTVQRSTGFHVYITDYICKGLLDYRLMTLL